MPHIITEYSSDISQDKIINLQQDIAKIFASMPNYFDFDQCKFRSLEFGQYFVGKQDQNSSSFIHVTAKILQGRPDKIRKELSDLIFQNIQKNFLKAKDRFDISVEIFEMNKESYNKIRI